MIFCTEKKWCAWSWCCEFLVFTYMYVVCSKIPLMKNRQVSGSMWCLSLPVHPDGDYSWLDSLQCSTFWSSLLLKSTKENNIACSLLFHGMQDVMGMSLIDHLKVRKVGRPQRFAQVWIHAATSISCWTWDLRLPFVGGLQPDISCACFFWLWAVVSPGTNQPARKKHIVCLFHSALFKAFHGWLMSDLIAAVCTAVPWYEVRPLLPCFHPQGRPVHPYTWWAASISAVEACACVCLYLSPCLIVPVCMYAHSKNIFEPFFADVLVASRIHLGWLAVNS